MPASDRGPRARNGQGRAPGGHHATPAARAAGVPSTPMSRRDGAVDLLLAVEIVLVLLLFGLGVALFIIPAASPDASPRWWVGVLLAILFFAAVFLDTIRRRRAFSATRYDAGAASEPEPRPRDPES